jgi:hypothetical protein
MLKNAAKQGVQKSVFVPRYFKIDGVCSTREKEVKTYYGVVGETEKKRPFGRRRHEWENSKNTSLKETGWKDD